MADPAGDEANEHLARLRLCELDVLDLERSAELAEDCGMLTNTDSWPNRCIDWEQAARELRMDYTSVDFDGVTYWIRS